MDNQQKPERALDNEELDEPTSLSSFDETLTDEDVEYEDNKEQQDDAEESSVRSSALDEPDVIEDEPQAVVASIPAPAEQTEQDVPAPAAPPHVSPLIIVLQWLTYAFWGWVIVAVASLIVSLLLFLMAGRNVAGFVPYGIAAVLVLLPLAVVCDLFYTKHEPVKKTGASAVVMVIHAVIFALLGIASLITGVFMLVKVMTDASFNSDLQVTLISSVLIAALYAAAFIRTINPFKNKLKLVPKLFAILMIAIIGLTIIGSIVGPITKARITRDDRLVDVSVGPISIAIMDYANDNQKLPNSLSDLTLSTEDAKTAVRRNLIEYKPYTRDAGSDTNRGGFTGVSSQTLYYQLCVNYKEKSSSYSARSYQTGDGYNTYPSTYNHPAGEHCYKLRTSYY